jgi:hypothetical protein
VERNSVGMFLTKAMRSERPVSCCWAQHGLLTIRRPSGT